MANTHEDQQLMARRMTERENQLADGEWTPEQLLEKIESGELSVMPRLDTSIDETEMPESEWIMPEQEHQLLTFLHKDVLRLAAELFPELKLVVHQTTLYHLKEAVTELNSELGEKLEYFKDVDQTYSNFSDVAAISLARQYLQYRDALRDEIESRKKLEKQKRVKSRKPTQLPLDNIPFLHFNTDKASKFFVESLMPNAVRPIGELQKPLEKLVARGFSIPPRFVAACVNDEDPKFTGFVGYTSDISESMFNFLQDKNALAIKAHIALGARAALETGAKIGVPISMSISQFCDDLGFKKHPKGGHRRENKRHALQILETLTRAELVVLWVDPKGKTHRTKGNIWQRGLSDEELDTYHDLLGTNRVPGTEDLWDPKTFSYSPGGYFADPEWCKYNKYVGLIGQGLLRLGTDNKDKAAVLIGGYIAFLGRIENYHRDPLKISTIIEKTGDLLTPYIKRREADRLETIIENTFDRLKAVKFIDDWEWFYDTTYKPFDSHSAVKMPELLSRRIKFTFPQPLIERGKIDEKRKLSHKK